MKLWCSLSQSDTEHKCSVSTRYSGPCSVIPAKAGIQGCTVLSATWIPAFAGMTIQYQPRCCSISTAGSTLPSTNSRKAPPPVEI